MRTKEIAMDCLEGIAYIRSKSVLGKLMFTGKALVVGEDKEEASEVEAMVSGRVGPEVRSFFNQIIDNKLALGIVGFLADDLMDSLEDAQDVKDMFRIVTITNRRAREGKLPVFKVG